MIGETVFHYRILDKIGEGGMGVVYKAEDIKLRRTVALKFLSQSSIIQGSIRERIMKEARAAASLDHPNICAIHEVEEFDDSLFIVMSYCEGSTLGDLMSKNKLGLEEALTILIQIADGLEAAHERGIVHRDIKPSNIIVSPKGRVKIMDFGLAKLSDMETKSITMTRAGTLAYMSPEQIRGDDIDRRSDIWSVGVMMYEMLTGRRPFEGDYEASVLYCIVNERHEPAVSLDPDIPAEINNIVERSLNKSPDDRYPSISSMRNDLVGASRLLFGESQAVSRETGLLGRIKGGILRRPVVSLSVLAALAASLTLIHHLFSGGAGETGPPVTEQAGTRSFHEDGTDPDGKIVQADMLYERGRFLYSQGKQHEGVPMMEQALELDPDHMDALRTLAVYYSWAEDNDKAAGYAKRAKEIAYRENDTKDYLFCNAIESFSLGKWDMAVKYYGELFEFEPDNLRIPLMIGYIKSKYLGDFEGAIEQCEFVLFKDPYDSLGLHGRCNDYMGTAYLHLGEYDKAIKAYDRYREICPDAPDPYTSIANAYRYNGQYEKAYALYSQQLSRKNPGFPVYEGLGKTCLEMGRWREAIEHFNRYIGSVSTDGHRVNGHLMLAHVYLLQKDEENAEGEIRKALSINPDCVKAHWYMGLKYLNLDGDVPAARRELLAMKSPEGDLAGIDSEAQQAHLRGLILLREGRAEGALESLREAVNLSPRESYFYGKELMSALIKLRRYDDAVGEADILRRINDNNPELMMLLCEAQKGIGRKSAAAEYYQKTLAVLESADDDFVPLLEFRSAFAPGGGG